MPYASSVLVEEFGLARPRECSASRGRRQGWGTRPGSDLGVCWRATREASLSGAVMPDMWERLVAPVMVRRGDHARELRARVCGHARHHSQCGEARGTRGVEPSAATYP